MIQGKKQNFSSPAKPSFNIPAFAKKTWDWILSRSTESRNEELWKLFLFFLFCAGLNVSFLAQSAFIGFHHHDWGGYWDAAWRISRGQKIYEDFYLFIGPGHIYFQALFFKLFGIGKTGILIQLAAVNTLVGMAVMFSVYKRIPFFFASICGVFTMLFYYWAYPHPYFDYTAHMWGILGTAVLARALPLDCRKAYFIGAAIGVFTVLTFMTKHNVGAAYGLIFGAVLAVSAARRRALIAFTVTGILFCTLLIALLPSPRAFFENLSYSGSLAERLTWLLAGKDWLRNEYWFPAAVMLLFGWPVFRRMPEKPVLFFGIAFVALFSTLTSSTFRHWPVYRPLAGLYLALGFWIFFDNWRNASARFHKFLCIAGITALSFILIKQTHMIVRQHYSTIKYKVGFITDFVVSSIPPERRYHLKMSEWTDWIHVDTEGQAFDDIVAHVSRIPKEDSFLVMSFFQVVYSLSGRDSYLHVPFHWDDKSPPPGKLWEKVRTGLIENPPDWILTSKDPGMPINGVFHYLQISPAYLQGYQLVKSWNEHALFKKVR